MVVEETTSEGNPQPPVTKGFMGSDGEVPGRSKSWFNPVVEMLRCGLVIILDSRINCIGRELWGLGVLVLSHLYWFPR